MGEINTHAGNLRLIGGALCLDFVNTVDCYSNAQPKEYLVSYEAVVAWSQHAGIVDDPLAHQLLQLAQRDSYTAASVHDGAIFVRNTLYRLFEALRHNQPPPPNDIAALNAELARISHAQLKYNGQSYAWAWPAQPALGQVLWPVLWSAAELLTSPGARQVRKCEGAGCSWNFLDTTGRRRWCSMQDCGNRAKARQHYARQRGQR